MLTKMETKEEPRVRNIDRARDFLSSYDVAVEQLTNTVLRVRADDREELQRLMEHPLVEMGYEWEPNAPGAGFGRFALRDKERGNVYLPLKPKGRQAADAGAAYEAHMTAVFQEFFPDSIIETAGFGAGSDLTISQNRKELKLELKTSTSADFGQFRLKYNTNATGWAPIETKKFLENNKLYRQIFTESLQPYLKDKHIPHLESPHYRRSSTAIRGLVRMTGTRNHKLILQDAWFGDKSDARIDVDPALIQNYYAGKGDELIQIRGRGVYTLTDASQKLFEVPQLKDMIKTSAVRFRIKPSGGSDSAHSFTAALKATIERSPFELEDPQFLEKIKNYLIN